MGNFYEDVLKKSPVFESPARQSDLGLLEPHTRTAVQAVIKDAASLGIKLQPFETFRSANRQMALFLHGVTKLKQVGVHHYGLACDLVKIVESDWSWKGDYSFLRELCLNHGLIWGGNWGAPNTPHTFVDMDHVQRCYVGDQPKLFRGEWYPGDSYLEPLEGVYEA